MKNMITFDKQQTRVNTFSFTLDDEDFTLEIVQAEQDCGDPTVEFWVCTPWAKQIVYRCSAYDIPGTTKARISWLLTNHADYLRGAIEFIHKTCAYMYGEEVIRPDEEFDFRHADYFVYWDSL